MKSLRRKIVVFVVMALALAGPLFGQLNTTQQAQVRVLADYLSAGVDLSGPMLAKHGYTPSVDASVWKQWPAFRKIETACLEAENAHPQRGATNLIALLTHDIANRNGAILEEQTLRVYRSKPDRTVLEFKALAPGQPRPELSENVVRAIDTLSQYTERGPLGSPQTILQRDFRLSEAQSYDILRQSGSTAEAMKRAMTFVPEQERIPILQSLYHQVSKSMKRLITNRRLPPCELLISATRDFRILLPVLVLPGPMFRRKPEVPAPAADHPVCCPLTNTRPFSRSIRRAPLVPPYRLGPLPCLALPNDTLPLWRNTIPPCARVQAWQGARWDKSA